MKTSLFSNEISLFYDFSLFSKKNHSYVNFSNFWMVGTRVFERSNRIKKWPYSTLGVREDPIMGGFFNSSTLLGQISEFRGPHSPLLWCKVIFFFFLFYSISRTTWYQVFENRTKIDETMFLESFRILNYLSFF